MPIPILVAAGAAVASTAFARWRETRGYSPSNGEGPDGNPLPAPDPELTRALTHAEAAVCEADTLRFQAARRIGVPFVNMVPSAWDTYDCHKKLEVYAYIMCSLAFYAEAAALLALANPKLLGKSWETIKSVALSVVGSPTKAVNKIGAILSRGAKQIVASGTHAVSQAEAQAQGAVNATQANINSAEDAASKALGKIGL